MKRTVKILAVASIMMATAIVSSPLPAMAQAQPACTHNWCDWYQSCVWQYWGWDPGTGWVLLTTDGSC
ncbi:MAG: hypothetical protein QOI57_2728 [Rubrobacteraceae bacterium]|jgi:hypothetical protein|nr:hypothetical protein [Rubrobacteraceae bacterium]